MTAFNKLKIVSGTWKACNKLLTAFGNSLAIQWLGLHAFAAGDMGSIPGWGTKILQVDQKTNKQKAIGRFHFFSVGDIDSSQNRNPETTGTRAIIHHWVLTTLGLLLSHL